MDAITLKTGTAVAIAAVAMVIGWRRVVRKHQTTDGEDVGNITLYRLDPPIGANYGDKSISTPCLKVQTFFRMCHVPHRAIFSWNAANSAPKGKLPICRVETGEVIEDSTFILKYFMENSTEFSKQVQESLCDKELTPLQKATGVAIQSLCEDKLYFILVYWRWGAGFSQLCQVFDLLRSMPWPLQMLVARKARHQLWQQGTGRHTQGEIEYLGQQAIDAIEDILVSAKTKFLFSDNKPSTFDAVLFATLSSIVEFDVDSPYTQYTATKPAVQKYIKTINELYWNHDK